ncbi:MAG: hypothetical protein ACREQV_19790, partial [Candidatus Binatia bacterium]
MKDKAFSILTLGYGYRLIEHIWGEVARRTGYQISHIPHPSLFPSDRLRPGYPAHASGMFFLFDRPQKSLPKADLNFLAELEGEGEATINNVILGDSRLRDLPYAEALDYISLAARRFQDVLSKTKPDAVLSGYDGFQSTLCMLVCRNMDVPWFALTYLPIPYGMTGFSSTNNSKGVRAFGAVDHSSIREQAELAISAFQKRSLVTHVAETENSLRNIFRFVPLRFRNFADNLASAISGRWDRFTRRSVLD